MNVRFLVNGKRSKLEKEKRKKERKKVRNWKKEELWYTWFDLNVSPANDIKELEDVRLVALTETETSIE